MNNDKLIKFYGGNFPDLFEIERRCMDRDNFVLNYLDRHLSDGLILDVGAGNGYSVEKLVKPTRQIIAMEPDETMIDLKKSLIWSKGVAQDIPFHDNSFDMMYSTWAFFFDGIEDIEEGISEIERVVKPTGKLIIIDNYGNDEFTSLADASIHSDPDFWTERGFEYEIIHTEFRFDNIDEARKLFTFYFGEKGRNINKLEFEYKVVAYTKTVK
ncbi:class I SAM-dependent methyltransferase [Salinicoccus hispanicus]|uniref:Methyltransferase domain-containing protein n=1 Tax=Salinicoccus hispanicus TaxID=157225 RepID=A0A6N8TZJ1_9STAP|nr:class I SAM-dependent methyltransferase [Salinicoccus hispanicus]MXQ50106.1 methyltransferase domain-containing protein [Salinicoccus hispanicus]